MILKVFARPGEYHAVEDQTKTDRKRHGAETNDHQGCLGIGTAQGQRHRHTEQAGAETAGGHNDSRTDPPQTFLFVRLEELFDLRQHIFSDSFQIARVFHFTDFVGYGSANFFTRRNSRSGDRVWLFQTHAHAAQVSAAGAAKLGRLTFFRSAIWTKHSR